MRINKPRQMKPRPESVEYGKDSHGKRGLVKAVMDRGFSKRVAELGVNAVFDAWKRAAQRGDRTIELPLGPLRITKTPKNIRKRRIATRELFGRPLPRLKTWTVNNDAFRIRWHVPAADFEELVSLLNPPAVGQQSAPRRREGNLMPESAPAPPAFRNADEELEYLLRNVYRGRLRAPDVRTLEETAGGRPRLIRCLRVSLSCGESYADGSFALFRTSVLYKAAKLSALPE